MAALDFASLIRELLPVTVIVETVAMSGVPKIDDKHALFRCQVFNFEIEAKYEVVWLYVAVHETKGMEVSKRVQLRN